MNITLISFLAALYLMFTGADAVIQAANPYLWFVRKRDIDVVERAAESLASITVGTIVFLLGALCLLSLNNPSLR